MQGVVCGVQSVVLLPQKIGCSWPSSARPGGRCREYQIILSKVAKIALKIAFKLKRFSHKIRGRGFGVERAGCGIEG